MGPATLPATARQYSRRRIYPATGDLPYQLSTRPAHRSVRVIGEAMVRCRGATLTEHRWPCTGVALAGRGVDYGHARGIRTSMDRARGARAHRRQPARYAAVR